LPPWLRVLATSRPREKVLSPMGQAFTQRQLDAEQAAKLNDIDVYTLSRCRQRIWASAWPPPTCERNRWPAGTAP
jgi:hypothetical protein